METQQQTETSSNNLEQPASIADIADNAQFQFCEISKLLWENWWKLAEPDDSSLMNAFLIPNPETITVKRALPIFYKPHEDTAHTVLELWCIGTKAYCDSLEAWGIYGHNISSDCYRATTELAQRLGELFNKEVHVSEFKNPLASENAELDMQRPHLVASQ